MCLKYLISLLLDRVVFLPAISCEYRLNMQSYIIRRTNKIFDLFRTLTIMIISCLNNNRVGNNFGYNFGALLNIFIFEKYFESTITDEIFVSIALIRHKYCQAQFHCGKGIILHPFLRKILKSTLQGFPQYCLHFSFVNISASKAFFSSPYH